MRRLTDWASAMPASTLFGPPAMVLPHTPAVAMSRSRMMLVSVWNGVRVEPSRGVESTMPSALALLTEKSPNPAVIAPWAETAAAQLSTAHRKEDLILLSICGSKSAVFFPERGMPTDRSLYRESDTRRRDFPSFARCRKFLFLFLESPLRFIFLFSLSSFPAATRSI